MHELRDDRKDEASQPAVEFLWTPAPNKNSHAKGAAEAKTALLTFGDFLAHTMHCERAYAIQDKLHDAIRAAVKAGTDDPAVLLLTLKLGRPTGSPVG